MSDVDDLLDKGSSGSGAPAVKFADIGDTCAGVITRVGIAETNSLNPPYELVKSVVLDITQKDGTDVTLWVRAGQMSTAITNAARDATGRTEKLLRAGDSIGVQFNSTNPPKKPGHSPMKVYVAQYRAGVTETVDAAGAPLESLI